MATYLASMNNFDKPRYPNGLIGRFVFDREEPIATEKDVEEIEEAYAKKFDYFSGNIILIGIVRLPI